MTVFLIIIVASCVIYVSIPDTIEREELELIGDATWYICVMPYKTSNTNFTDEMVFNEILPSFSEEEIKISNTTNWYILIISYQSKPDYADLRLVFDWYVVKDEFGHEEVRPVETRIRARPVNDDVYSIIYFSLDEVLKEISGRSYCEIWLEIRRTLVGRRGGYTIRPEEIWVNDFLGSYQNGTFYIRAEELNIDYPIYVYVTRTVENPLKKDFLIFYFYPLILLFVFLYVTLETIGGKTNG